jgi:hypothetical protein
MPHLKTFKAAMLPATYPPFLLTRRDKIVKAEKPRRIDGEGAQ